MSAVAPPPEAAIAQPAYWRLKDFIIGSTGLAYYADRDQDLSGRILSRMQQLDLSDCAAYFELLGRGPAGETELDRLTEQLTIGETYFFRHQEAFDALRTVVLPDLIRRNQAQRRLRIWSAGCATGAEPYSLAILLKHELREVLADWDVTILGTDINREYLAAARSGRFEQWAMRSTPPAIRDACFDQQGQHWQIKPAFQECVSFQYHNLVRHPCPSLLHGLFAFDVILCRNVMIYFSNPVIRRIIGQCRECLVDGGWLLVGHAESNTAWFENFRTLTANGAVLYQKADPAVLAADAPSDFHPPTWGERSVAPLSPPRRPASVAIERVPANRTPSFTAPTIADIRALADRGQLEAAARACEQLLRRDRLNPTAHLYQALIFKQMDLHQAAEAALKRAIYLNRDYVVAYYYLGVVLQAQGERREAKRAFRNLLDLLAGLDRSQPVADADEMSVVELEDLARIHMQEMQSK